MLLLSNNLRGKIQFPKDAVVRVNSAWVKTEKDLQESKERLIGLKKISSEESASVMNELIFYELVGKAEDYYKDCDYKAAAVYTRSAFEKTLRKYCEDKKKKITFKSKLKDYTTQDFWSVVSEDVNSSIQSEIEKYRALVLNPFSHYNTERHEIKTELKEAIEAVKKLKNELNN